MGAALTETDEAAAETPGRRRRLLDTLPVRQRLTGEQAAARSLWVKRLRIILPTLAVILILALLVNTNSGNRDDAFLDDFANLEATPEELRMANPRFAGVDDSGNPYDITAQFAVQAPDQREVVDLVRPRALTTGVNARTEITADKGVFKTEEDVLDLTNGVTVNHSVGDEVYVFTTPAATVLIDEETVHSNAGVEGWSRSGILRADRMRAYNNEGRTVFEGNVSMRIFPKKGGLIETPKMENNKEENEGSQ